MGRDGIGIGRLAAETGCRVQTIRYYEQIGLMPTPIRTEGNQRRYGEAHVRRLGFIRHARELGFPIDAIRELLALADQPERPCDAVDALARRHLAEVERRLSRLRALRTELTRMIEACEGGRVRDCRIVEALAESGAITQRGSVPAVA